MDGGGPCPPVTETAGRADRRAWPVYRLRGGRSRMSLAEDPTHT